jgi:hypothetical protein
MSDFVLTRERPYVKVRPTHLDAVLWLRDNYAGYDCMTGVAYVLAPSLAKVCADLVNNGMTYRIGGDA